MALVSLEEATDGLIRGGGLNSLNMASRGLLGGGEAVAVEEVTSSGGMNFQARPTQEAIDKWLAQELDPTVREQVREKVKAKVLLPLIGVEGSDYADLEAQREAIERFSVPLMPSQIERVKSGVVSINDLLPDYNLDEMDEEAIVLLMMMRM